MSPTSDTTVMEDSSDSQPNAALLAVPLKTDSGRTSPALAWRSGSRPTFPTRSRRNSTTSSQGSSHFPNHTNIRMSRASSRPVETTRLSIPTIKAPRSTASDSESNPITRTFNRRRSAISLRSEGSDRSTRTSSPNPGTGPSAALQAGSWWREGPMPRHLRDHLEHRHVADPRSLSGGCMVWVPAKEIVGVDLFCIREGHPCGGEQLNDTGFDHPAVVLGVYKEVDVRGEEKMYCTVAQMRTFKRTSHVTYTSAFGQQFRESIPIRYPEPEFPEGRLGDQVEQLDLLRGELFNQTYIQLQHIFKVPASKIMVFHFGSRLATDVKLTDESYIRLMHLFGYTEEMGADGSVPAFGPSPPPNSRMHGYYGSNFPKPKLEYDANELEWC